MNYGGMWKRRFEKDDRKIPVEGERAGVEEREREVVEVGGERVEKVMGRLSRLNEGLVGLV